MLCPFSQVLDFSSVALTYLTIIYCISLRLLRLFSICSLTIFIVRMTHILLLNIYLIYYHCHSWNKTEHCHSWYKTEGGYIANISSLRPKKSTNAATALVQVLQGKGSMSHLMTKDDRDNLARNIQKLLRATYASPDPDGLMGKLRAALDSLVALPTAATAVERGHQTETGVLGVKRSLGAVDEEIEGIVVS